MGLKYCLTRFRVALGEENVEKQRENQRFKKRRAGLVVSRVSGGGRGCIYIWNRDGVVGRGP